MQLKKSLLMILIAFSSSGCSSSIEIIHKEVGCEGQPSVSIGMTNDELIAINGSDNEETKKLQDSALSKIFIFAKILRKRIESQCKINAEHDRLHGEDK